MNLQHLQHLRSGLRYSPFFVGSLFLLLTALGLRTSYLRGRFGIFAGDGGNKELHRASRAHGLGVEHGVPLALLLVLLELQGASKGAVITFGLLILAARAAAAAGTTLAEKKIGTPSAAFTYGLELVLSCWVLIESLRAF